MLGFQQLSSIAAAKNFSPCSPLVLHRHYPVCRQYQNHPTIVGEWSALWSDCGEYLVVSAYLHDRKASATKRTILETDTADGQSAEPRSV